MNGLIFDNKHVTPEELAEKIKVINRGYKDTERVTHTNFYVKKYEKVKK